MSSGPAFPPDQALGWEYKCVGISALGNYFVAGWRVMRIQVFGKTGTVAVRLTEGEVPVVAGGCLTLEPNGYMTTAVAVAGTAPADTFAGTIEFLYPVQADGISPSP